MVANRDANNKKPIFDTESTLGEVLKKRGGPKRNERKRTKKTRRDRPKQPNKNYGERSPRVWRELHECSRFLQISTKKGEKKPS